MTTTMTVLAIVALIALTWTIIWPFAAMLSNGKATLRYEGFLGNLIAVLMYGAAIAFIVLTIIEKEGS